MKSAFFVLVAVLVSNVSAWAAPSYGERNFADLVKDYSKATPDPIPWAGYWWPYSDDGLADGSWDRDKVSPIEKIDQVFNQGNSATNWEVARHGSRRSSSEWWGHCNGWATAAIMENEPRDLVTIEGVKFGVADRKALLSEYWLESGSDFVGTRVWNKNDYTSAAFWDVKPAAFFLLLTNVVGAKRQAVIIDRYTGSEVWNQPLVGYEIHPIRPEDYLGPDRRYSNVYRVNVTTTIWWASDEIEADAVTPQFKWDNADDFFDHRTLRYELWLDGPVKFDSRGNMISSGDVILSARGSGGTWKNGTSREALNNSHPDFMWIPLSYARSSGYKNPRIHDSWIKEHLTD